MRQLLVPISAILLIASTAGAGPAGASEPDRNIDHCQAISDGAARLHCFEDLTLSPFRTSSAPNGWKLIRTPRPQGGEAISMIHTPDLERSDPDFAGLMLRCGDRGLEIFVVVISPFSPRSHPVVTVPSSGNYLKLIARPAPTGEALRLPDEALALANGPWQSLVDLSIKIEDPPTSISGVVPIAGLDAAMKALNENCASP